ncbi:MAG: ATP-binding protein [Firmicutes bacterium]|nr:ATP-binding protein [Bacillota bacterium]
MVVVSGKGGTGKTTVTAALAVLASARRRLVLADTDVDAANLGLVTRPEPFEEEEFRGARRPRFDTALCRSCAQCVRACRFGALADASAAASPVPRLDPWACEGCGICAYVCPTGAVTLRDVPTGTLRVSETPFGPLVDARLEPGEGNSGKLVSRVRARARELALERGAHLIISDGPPGIGCPVISALSGAHLAVAVTEPSLSAVHDLRRLLEVTRHFRVPVAVVVNRADLDRTLAADLERRCLDEGVEVLGRVPYDPAVTRALLAGRAVVENGPGPATEALAVVWDRLERRLGGELGEGDAAPAGKHQT